MSGKEKDEEVNIIVVQIFLRNILYYWKL